MRDAVIVDAVRTPLGKGKATGSLAPVHPVDLLATPLRALAERNHLDPGLLDDVVVGTVSQVGEQAFNVGRRAVLAAGFPERVPATTVDRQCGSSQQAISFAAQGVQAGAYDLVIAGGVESMSRVPMGSPAAGAWDLDGRRFAERYPEGMISQGVASELIAAKWGVSRAELDEFGLRSQELARGATDWGAFANEVVGVEVIDDDGSRRLVTADEGLRATTLEGLAALRPAFVDERMEARFPQIEWSITAGTSSQLTDGAAALLIASEERAAELGLRPRARVHTTAVEADDPLFMLTAVIPVTHKVLAKAGPDPEGHRPVRGQRGLRLGRAGVGARRRRRHGEGQRERRRHRPRPSARRVGRPAGHDAGQRPRAARQALRPPDHVRGRRHRQRHDLRAPRLTKVAHDVADSDTW